MLRRLVGAAGLHVVPVNVAGEATAYLKFVVDYYHALPVRMLFLHSHRSAGFFLGDGILR